MAETSALHVILNLATIITLGFNNIKSAFAHFKNKKSVIVVTYENEQDTTKNHSLQLPLVFCLQLRCPILIFCTLTLFVFVQSVFFAFFFSLFFIFAVFVLQSPGFPPNPSPGDAA